MKLTTDSIYRLDQLIQTAMIAGLKKIIIDGTNKKIRGIDEKQSVVVLTEQGVPDIGSYQIAINRPEQLYARLNLVKASGDLVVDATIAANNEDISILEISAGKTKAQFRCASVEAVKGVPKSINDTHVWQVKVKGKLISVVAQGAAAMGSDTITIASKDGQTVSFECVEDKSKDIFTTDLEDAPLWIGSGTAATSFCRKYPTKTLLALLKEAAKTDDTVSMQIGDGGILSLKVNKLDFSVIPAQ